MRSIIASAFVLLIGIVSVSAQEQGIFGDSDQPGTRLHQQIVDQIGAGNDEQAAISESITSALSEESVVLDTSSKSAIALNIELAQTFFNTMLQENSLIEVTKVLLESNSEFAGQVVALGTYLYPDFAQEILDGAMLTGVMSNDDLLAIILASGADPATVSTATAAAAAPVATAPIGAGIGGGGAGGGDTTASTN